MSGLSKAANSFRKYLRGCFGQKPTPRTEGPRTITDAEVEKIIAEADRVVKSIAAGGQVKDVTRLLSAVKDVARALEGPEICLANLAMAPVGYAVLRTAIDLGIFRHFGDGPMHILDLTVQCGADEDLLARIMRGLIGHGIFKYSTPRTFVHTAQSRALQNPLTVAVVRGLAEQAEVLPVLPEYLSTISYNNPPSGKEGFFPYARKTPLTVFEWLEEHPTELKHFQDFQSAKDEMTGEKLKARYRQIIESELLRLKENFDVEKGPDPPVLICDIGGGRGLILKDAMEEVIAKRGSVKGRVVVEDLPNVVKGHESQQGWEAVPHDFFNEQPVKGACVYQLRDVLHNWSDDSAQKILANTSAAMDAHSRIVIGDTVLSETDPPLFLANMDIFMMQFGGLERTEEDWKRLLRTAGLELQRIEAPEKGNRMGEMLIWAKLKST